MHKLEEIDMQIIECQNKIDGYQQEKGPETIFKKSIPPNAMNHLDLSKIDDD